MLECSCTRHRVQGGLALGQVCFLALYLQYAMLLEQNQQDNGLQYRLVCADLLDSLLAKSDYMQQATK